MEHTQEEYAASVSDWEVPPLSLASPLGYFSPHEMIDPENDDTKQLWEARSYDFPNVPTFGHLQAPAYSLANNGPLSIPQPRNLQPGGYEWSPPIDHFQRPQSVSPCPQAAMQEISHQFDLEQDEEVVHQSVAESPLFEAVEYPNAATYLRQNNPISSAVTPLRKVPDYDYTFLDERPISFTAVEIITFLPKLCRNKWVATRLLNAGLSVPAHFEIHKTHRLTAANDGISLSTIGNCYLDAMRGLDWRNQAKEQQSTWTRKRHKVPKDWKASLAMNEFVPDRILYGIDVNPKPVPFSDLLKDVKQIPAGDDAADLTRAIDFAVGNPMQGGRVWLFPDDLALILNFIGRTNITLEHQDCAVAGRYAQKHAEKKDTNVEAQPSSIAMNHNPQSVADTAAAIRQQQARHAPQLPFRQAKHTLAQPSPLQLQQQRQQSSMTPPQPMHSEKMAAQPSVLPNGLIRESILHSNLPEYMTDVIRFAQRPDQLPTDWRWNVSHSDRICEILNAENAEEARKYIQETAQADDTPYLEVHGVEQTACYDADYWDPASLTTNPTFASIPMTCDEFEDLFDSSGLQDLAIPERVDFGTSQTPSCDLEELLATGLLASHDCFELTEEDMRGHVPTDLLRECVEGEDKTDDSKLAQAARIA